MKIYASILLSIAAGVTAFAQQDTVKCTQVYVKGRVYDTLQPQGFYNMMVINKSEGKGVFGMPNGSFSLYTKDKDTIALTVKEYAKYYYIVEADTNCQFIIDQPLSPKAQEFEEVRIYPLKSLDEIKKERQELSMRETRTVTGINVVQSPITALYERFSKTGKAKKKVAEMEHQDNIDAILKELLRLYVSNDVGSLKEEYFSDFVDFLNIDENFLRTSTDYELVVFIKDKLEHYKYFHPEYFRTDEEGATPENSPESETINTQGSQSQNTESKENK
ncbi:hypothetical protein SAMN05216474_0589 [Lishizhenia tianjinensis]|uniref:CarboxypepD_reg-like domain-containing protein n=1 Tax=Lishizhenia tianjinensis TaxID=477690 RepID=A0A1I6Y169_9FLAO|nr:hypothetical protein [Lishizhenia tianjinensis]SFT44166.1 hypothetical protein SAMN05216474_0589 [Lishizhenia tianjinensis]